MTYFIFKLKYKHDDFEMAFCLFQNMLDKFTIFVVAVSPKELRKFMPDSFKSTISKYL